MTLKEVKIGRSSIITKVGGEGALRQHFLDMGIIPGVEVTVVKYAPMGDPVELLLHGYKLTLRLEDAGQIEVTPIADSTVKSKKHSEKTASQKKKKTSVNIQKLNRNINVTDSNTRKDKKELPEKNEHPGLGEGGRFHPRGSGDPLPESSVLTFALVGNQNCGKTTLFNRLTGAKQHVGNFPGVTVDRKDGAIKGYKKTLITDLPGIYSMSPYSSEEIVSRNFVLNEKPNAIINIVDATNIERNLYLTMQLLEMNVPMVVALNMMDEVHENGGTINVNKMEKMLGVPVVPISAAKNEGVNELIEHAVHIAKYQEKPVRQDYCGETDHGGAVHRCLHSICHLIEDHAVAADLPLRFAAAKVVEGDELIISKLKLDNNEKETVEHIVIQMEKERKLDRSAAIAGMRFSFIEKVCKYTVLKPGKSKQSSRSEEIDRILTGKFTAIPIFILIMALVFYLTFNVIGSGLQELLEGGIDQLKSLLDNWMTSAGVNQAIHSLITDGILTGVGSVVSFLPIIVTLFLFLSLLEDSGYIARVAFVMDRLLRKLGLSGRSIVPMLIGFGCTVPAVMSTRTLPSERDRRLTILLTPFMSCTAKLPIYAFFVDAFFPQHKALIMVGLYLLGIVIGILIMLLYKNTIFKGEAVPFVMELPNYRLPGPGNVVRLLWEKAKDFLQKAFTVILVATVVIWVLTKFDIHFNMVDNSQDSILAMIAGVFVPVMRPTGLGDWRICTSLFSGFMAKESVISTIEVLFSDGVNTALTSLQAASLMVFSLLYTPCIAAIASIKRELGSKWALAVVLWQCFIAWIASLIVYSIGTIFA